MESPVEANSSDPNLTDSSSDLRLNTANSLPIADDESSESNSPNFPINDLGFSEPDYMQQDENMRQALKDAAQQLLLR